jgi:hypothetical protein
MQDTITNNPLDKKLSGGEVKEEIKRVITGKDDQAPQLSKKEEEAVKDEIEEEVKESFQDEDVPVEPAVGNDGLEVGGEG